jgi:hypothetical protein
MRNAGNLLILTQGLLVSGTRPVRPLSRVCPRLSPFLLSDRQVSSGASMTAKKTLAEWSFSPSQLASRLPLDPDTENRVRRNVPGAVFSKGL